MNVNKKLFLVALVGASVGISSEVLSAWTATQNTLWLQAQESMQRAGGDMDILREFSSGLQQHGGLDAYNYVRSKMSSLPPRVWRALVDVCCVSVTKPWEKKLLMQRIVEDDINAATNDRDLQLKIEDQVWQNPFPARQYLQEMWSMVQGGRLNATDLRLYGARYSWFPAQLQKDMSTWIVTVLEPVQKQQNRMKDIWEKVQYTYSINGGYIRNGGAAALAYVDQASKDAKTRSFLSDTSFFKKDLMTWIAASDAVLKTPVGAAAAKIENEIKQASKIEGQKYGTLWANTNQTYYQQGQSVAAAQAYLQQNAANIPLHIVQDISAYITALHAQN